MMNKDEYKIRVYIVLTEFNSIQYNNIPFTCGRNTHRDIYQTLHHAVHWQWADRI